MTGFAAIYRRELAGLFLSPLAWILLCLTLFWNGFLFVYFLETTGGEVNSALSGSLGAAWPFWVLMMILVPLLTMRMVSEESKSGMLEFLLTAPVGDGAVIAGKAFAATTFLGLLWLCVPAYALLGQLLGATPDWGTVATGWLGALLVSALFVAMGLVASALTDTPVLAAFLAFLANVVVIGVPSLVRFAPGARSPALDWTVAKIDVAAHFQASFQTGALDSAHVIFFVAWTAAALFIAVRLVERRRWL